MVIEMCGTCKWYSVIDTIFKFEIKCRKHRIPTVASALAVTMNCKEWAPKEGE